MVVNFHYCMGKIASISFHDEQQHQKDACDQCGMSKTKNHCCKDVLKSVKLNASHQASQIAFELAAISTVHPIYPIAMQVAVQGTTAIHPTVYFSPPPNTLNKVYRVKSVFLI